MDICRTRFKKQIITEFMPAAKRNSGKVLIFCAGVPGSPDKDELLNFYAKKNFWTFFPRYRGSWESEGNFLAKCPSLDILDVISCLDQPFNDYWEDKTYHLIPNEIIIMGSSFGGPAALLASRDPRVKKVICLAPVVDWLLEDKFDPLDNLYELMKHAYGAAYRIRKKDWNKLKKGKFYNPNHIINQLSGEKILIFHAHDDDVVSIKPIIKFSKQINAKLITFKTGGHLSSATALTKRNYQIIKTFIS